jgi:hypothetical protein
MALATASGAAAFDITANTGKLDLSEELAEIIRTDNTSLISRIGVGHFQATQLTHRWNEDKLNPNTATLNEALDTSETGVDVASGHGVRFKVGTLFKNNSQGKTEVMRVTAISTDTLTVERGHGSTSGEAHDNASTLMIIGHTKNEGWTPTQEDWTQERSSTSNFLSTTGYGIAITRRRQAIDHAGIPSEFAHQAAYRLKEYMRQLDSMLINSVKSATEGSDTDYSSMGGLIEFVSATGGNITNSAQDITTSVVNASVEQIWNDGGLVAGGRLGMVVSGKQKRNISSFDQAFRRMDFDSKSSGYVVEKFLSDLGFEIEVIVDPWMPDDTAIIGDLNRLKVGPLTGDGVGLEDLAKTGRLIEAMVTGTYTTEVRNALEAWAIISNLN